MNEVDNSKICKDSKGRILSSLNTGLLLVLIGTVNIAFTILFCNLKTS